MSPEPRWPVLEGEEVQPSDQEQCVSLRVRREPVSEYTSE